MSDNIAPPAYDTLIASFQLPPILKSLESSIVTAAINLSDRQKEAIANYVIQQIKNLNPEEKEKLGIGLIKALSSNEGQDVVRATARQTNATIKQITDGMSELRTKLAGYDTTYNLAEGDKFAPKMAKHIDNFNTTIGESRTLASNISQQASKLATELIPKVTDASLSLDQRKTLIQEYSRNAGINETATIAMQNKFKDFRDQFTVFVGTFDTFAEAKIGAVNKDIRDLQAQADELSKKVNELSTAASATLGAGLGIAAIGGCLLGLLFPPALPAILVGAAITAGVAGASAAGVGAAANYYSNQLAAKNNEISALKKKVQEMEAARADLKHTSEKDLSVIKNAIGALLITWQSATTNLHEIQAWLDRGADLANIPWAVKNNVQNVVDIYKTMALYLEGYAQGAM